MPKISFAQQTIETADSSDIVRFWQKVSVVGDCWIWTGSFTKGGRARFSVNSFLVSASRFAYNTFVGPIPEGLLVLHTCDNPACANFKDHLFLGTHSDNTKDCVMKGRANRKVPHPGVSGTKNGRSKISEEDLSKIRSLLPTHRDCDIIRLFDYALGKKQISYIRRGFTYKEKSQSVEHPTAVS